MPFLDLRAQYRGLAPEIEEAVLAVLRSGEYILGRRVAEFEQDFAAFCGSEHAIGVNSGTSALHLALLAAGVGPGDEVVTTPFTFFATVEAILYTGAWPVFADLDPQTGNLDPAAVERVLTARTRALLPVHLYGRPANMTALADLARRHGLALIEDACQAHGAAWDGQPVGSFGLAAAFSFYPTKNLSACGEGGAVVTNHAEIAERIRELRNHGQRERYRHETVGFNYRMEAFQAAILRIKLRWLPQWNEARYQLASLYRHRLTGTRVELPVDDPRARVVYHVFAILLE